MARKIVDIFQKRIHFPTLSIVLKNETSLPSWGARPRKLVPDGGVPGAMGRGTFDIGKAKIARLSNWKIFKKLKSQGKIIIFP